MAFTGVFPMAEGPINTPVAGNVGTGNTNLGPAGMVGTVQLQNPGQPVGAIAPRSITWPKDLSTLTSGGVTVTLNPSMQDPSSYIGQLNAAGIPVTINLLGELVLTGVSVVPTASDANLLKVLGLT